LKGTDLTTYVIRCIIDREVQDVIETSAAAIENRGCKPQRRFGFRRSR